MIAIPARRNDLVSSPLAALLALLSCALVGVAAVIEPMAAVGLAALLYFALRGEGVVRDALMLVLIGNMVLNYGFANIGIHIGPLPLPFTDMVVVALFAWCVLYRSPIKEIGLPAAFMFAIIALGTVRLLADFPTYQTLAVRDYTTSLETTALVIGFCAYRMYGLQWSNRFWLITCLAVALYAILYPFADLMQSTGIVVGLQQPVPLFGNYAGMGPATGAAFLFFMLRVKAPLSLLLGAMCLGAMLLFQARGIYIGVPLAVFVVLILGERLKTRIGLKLLGALAFGALLLALVLPLGIRGRMGPVSLSFVTQQLGTLVGQEGAGDGSYEDRLQWLRTVQEKQQADPASIVWGLGLGPDLTGGATGGAEFIRKPHNDYVEIFARFGIIGAVLWVGFLGTLSYALVQGVRNKRRTRNERTFLLWLIASLVLYLFISATQPQLAYAYGTLPVFVMFGMGLALVRGPLGVEKDAEESDLPARRRPVFDMLTQPAKPRTRLHSQNVTRNPPKSELDPYEEYLRTTMQPGTRPSRRRSRSALLGRWRR